VKVPSAFAVIPRLMASLLPRLIAVVVAVFMAEIPYLLWCLLVTRCHSGTQTISAIRRRVHTYPAVFLTNIRNWFRGQCFG
jgi:hypothetical protein